MGPRFQVGAVMVQPWSWVRPRVRSRLRLMAAQRWAQPSWLRLMP
ncbi:MAG: hypothetical protein ACI8Y4_005651, partial [Candidatus Poriferisodalaceae bacterium]